MYCRYCGKLLSRCVCSNEELDPEPKFVEPKKYVPSRETSNQEQKKQPKQKERKKRSKTSKRPNKPKSWTKEEESFIINNYNEMTLEQIIKALNRSQNSVERKIRRLIKSGLLSKGKLRNQ